MQFFNKYGQVNGTVYSTDATQYAVLDQPPSGGGSSSLVRTYIVENVASSPLPAVHFSDGYIVENVPARTVYAVTVTRNQPGGAVVTTVTNTYVIPNVAGKPPAPPAGTGTNLYVQYSPGAPPPTQAQGTVEPLALQPPSNPGLVPLTALDPTGKSSDAYNYPYDTPYVRATGGPFQFAGKAPTTNMPALSFQAKNVSGTYIPGQDTAFQLSFKSPLGQINPGHPGSVLLVGVQVIYALGDAANTQYVETYPLTSFSFIGGIVYDTNQLLGTPPTGTDVPGNPLWSGVVSATRTVGQGTVNDNTHFSVYDGSTAGNTNLIDPGNDAHDTKLSQIRGRTAQFSTTPFTMTGGTVTMLVYIAQFSQFSTQTTDPVIEFVPGLAGYAGLVSSLTIPFRDVTIAGVTNVGAPTQVGVTSPAPGAVFDMATGNELLAAAVTSAGGTVNEGAVTFLVNGAVVGTAPVVAGVAVLPLNAPLPAGLDTIAAVYADPAGLFATNTSAGQVVEVDTVLTTAGMLTVKEPDGTSRLSATPFGRRCASGLNVAGLALGDGLQPELVVAPRRGAAPKVFVYNARTGAVVRSFLAYPRGFRGGVTVAAVTLNNSAEIITAPGRGARPLIKVFDAATGRQERGFLAFDRRFQNGVALTTAVTAGGNGFTINAQTTRRGRTYIQSFDGLTGVPVGPLRTIQASSFGRR
jgi:hypothetical protein